MLVFHWSCWYLSFCWSCLLVFVSFVTVVTLTFAWHPPLRGGLSATVFKACHSSYLLTEWFLAARGPYQ